MTLNFAKISQHMSINFAKCWKRTDILGLGTAFRIFLKMLERWKFHLSETVSPFQLSNHSDQEKRLEPASLGGLLSKTKPHSTQQGERDSCQPSALWLVHDRKSSHWAHPRVSAWFQRPLALLWASRGTEGNWGGGTAGSFFTRGE